VWTGFRGDRRGAPRAELRPLFHHAARGGIRGESFDCSACAAGFIDQDSRLGSSDAETKVRLRLSFDAARFQLGELLLVGVAELLEEPACRTRFLLVDLERAKPTWIRTESPVSTSPASRPTLTLRRQTGDLCLGDVVLGIDEFNDLAGVPRHTEDSSSP
jgi:hypothetical protein